jgi:hypothetical protein
MEAKISTTRDSSAVILQPIFSSDQKRCLGRDIVTTSLVRFLTTSLHEHQPLPYPGYLLIHALYQSQEQSLLILQYHKQSTQFLCCLPLLPRSKVVTVLWSHDYFPEERYIAQAIMKNATAKPIPTQTPNTIPSMYA